MLGTLTVMRAAANILPGVTLDGSPS
jgi:hypothetical protein